MNMRVISVAIALAVLVAWLSMALGSGSIVANAMVEKVYYLSAGDVVVYHKYGLTAPGYGYVYSIRNYNLPQNFTVCARLLTVLGYKRTTIVLDHGRIYNANWWIEGVPAANYRFNLATSNGVVSVDIPGEYGKPHMYCINVAVNSGGSGGVINVYIDGVLNKSVSFSGSRIVNPDLPIVFGGGVGLAMGVGDVYGRNATLTLLLVYNRSLTVTTETVGTVTIVKSEYADIAKGVIPYSGLVLHLDPTIMTYLPIEEGGIGRVWLDPVNSEPFEPYINMVGSGIMLLFTDDTTFYVVKTAYSDNYVHFKFFPYYSRVEIYDLLGTYYESFVTSGFDNGLGLVIDYPVRLTSRNYRVVYYDPNENITVTATVTETVVVPTETATVTATVTTPVVSYRTVTTTAIENITVTATVTETVVVPVVSYSTVTTTVTVAAGVKWDWLIIVAMAVILCLAIWYLLRRRR
jgi:hypothetical protein